MRIIGHRGAKGYAPENTLASFEKAAALGVDAVEFDVHLSGDDRPVVIHDFTVDRTTNGFGPVRALSLEQLKGLDAGEGERIPTLEETLDWASGRPAPGLVIEIKGNLSLYPGISEKVMDAILSRGLERRTIVIAFDYAVIHELKDLTDRIRTGVLIGAPVADAVALARELHADAILPRLDVVDPELVRRAHEAGLEVHAWVANTAEAVRFAASAGVDGVATDFPDVARRASLRVA